MKITNYEASHVVTLPHLALLPPS